MIADSTFASDFLHEQRLGVTGPARIFFAQNRAKHIRLTIITAGEISVAFAATAAARQWLDRWQILFLHMGIVDKAAEIDRELIARGRRLGENDNWIAGFARYYREPLISRDRGFDAVPGLRRLAY
jgi:predicted nucleic acid-binding protein